MRETAVPSALEAAALVKQHWGNRSEPYVYARVLLGAAQWAQKEYEDSVKTYQEAYDLQVLLAGAEDPAATSMAITLAEVFLDLGDHDRASAVFDSISGTLLESASREGEVSFLFDRVKGLLLARQGTDRARKFIEAMGETGESTIDAGDVTSIDFTT
jgi:tetratricopeptide (TPR) repeat protein